MDKIKTLAQQTFKRFDKILDYVVIIKCGEKTESINSIEKDPHKFIHTQTITNLKKVLDLFDKYYYNTSNQLVKDSTYDVISDYYYNTTELNKGDKIGAEVYRNKVKLPIYMGSMDKVKLGQASLTKFLKSYRNNKFISSKLDGISLLIGKVNNIPKAYTRGNGIYGKDVSQFLKFIKTSKGQTLYNILKHIDNNIFIRGELIISKKNWKKSSHMGSNARNMAMGILNRKLITKDVRLCDFVGYQYISNLQLSISEQFKKIKALNIDIPYNKLYLNKNINVDFLPVILDKFKNKSEYEIDGIIVQDDIYYPINIDKNPKYAKAFKMEKYNEQGISIVESIEWNPSKSGILKPVILIKPIHLSDVIIKRIYVYHAKYVMDNGIGKGSKIEIVRSGDVIPKVKSVISKNFNIDSDFPSKYIWNSNKLDIELIEFDKNVILAQLEYFVKIVDIEFCKRATLEKLYNVGIKSVKDFIKIQNLDTILQIERIKNTLANKILTSIKTKLANLNLETFMAAIPIFNGISIKRMKLLIKHIPKFYKIPKEKIFEKIIKIKGFSTKIAEVIIKDLDKSIDYIIIYKKYYTRFKRKVNIRIINGKYNNRVFCFSGIRDKLLEKNILLEGGFISTNMGNDVTDLVVKDINSNSSKINKAKKNNIRIISYNNFPK